MPGPVPLTNDYGQSIKQEIKKPCHQHSSNHQLIPVNERMPAGVVLPQTAHRNSPFSGAFSGVSAALYATTVGYEQPRT